MGILNVTGRGPVLPRGRRFACFFARAAEAAGILLIVCGMCQAADAVVDPSLVQEVKAVFLYKFQIYVSWPHSAFVEGDDPFNLCIVGQPGLANLIEQAVRGEMHEGHPIRVLLLPGLTAESRCHLAFISSPNTGFLRQELGIARSFPTLTVTDADGPVQGMINFVIESDHIRFAIDDAAARQVGLDISSKLLHLAVSGHQE